MKLRLAEDRKKICIVFLSTFLLIFISLFGLINIGTIPTLADSEPNDNFVQAHNLSLNSTVYGSINTTDFDDYYGLQVDEPLRLIIQFSVNSTDPDPLYLEFYDNTETKIKGPITVQSGQSHGFWLAFNSSNIGPTMGHYYIVIKGFGGWGNYTLTVSFQDPNDGGVWGDAGETQGTARSAITNYSPNVGWLDGNYDPTDLYKFNVADGYTIKIEIGINSQSNQYGRIDIEVFRWGEIPIWIYNGITPSSTKNLEYTLNSTSGDTFYLKIIGNCSYTFKLKFNSQNDADSLGDIPEDSTYLITAFDVIHGGLIGDEDIRDAYEFNIDGGYRINLTVSGGGASSGSINVRLFNTTHDEKMNYNDLGEKEAIFFNYLTSTLTGGKYYLEILVVSRNSYTFKINATPQNDANSGGDAIEPSDPHILPDNPTPIQEGLFMGELGDDDEYDVYGMEIKLGQAIYANVTSSKDLSMRIYLFNNETGPTTYGLDSELFSGIGETASVYWAAEYKGFVYIWIEISGYSEFPATKFYHIDINIINVLVDTTPPVISNINVEASEYGATIFWKTDDSTNGSLYYGLNNSYGSVVEDFNSITSLNRTHNVSIYNLEPGKTYHYKIVCWNKGRLMSETLDGTFRIPRYSYVPSQYNALRTFMFVEMMGEAVGSQVKITLNCYDKGIAITPDNILVTSSGAVDEITVSRQAEGVYIGTYQVTQDDVDAEEVTLFADITYQGDNDTAVFSTELGEEELYNDWEVNMQYLSNEDYAAGFGDSINFKIIVTKNGEKAEPQDISAWVEDYDYYTRFEIIDEYSTPLEVIKTGIGEYTISYTLPLDGEVNKEFEFEVEITNNDDTESDYFYHEINIYNIWYHILSMTESNAEVDMYVTDLDNIVIPSADIEMSMSYETSYGSDETTEKKKTDFSGKTNYQFDYPNNVENGFEISGSVTINNKTQYFDYWFMTNSEEVDSGPVPWGDALEIFPVYIDDSIPAFYTIPDAQGKIKRDYLAFSNEEILKNTNIYYYILSSDEQVNIVKAGATKTNNSGGFSIEFKPSGTRQTSNLDYYYIQVEAPVGEFAEFDLLGKVTSRDGKYYAETSDYFMVMDAPASFTWEDILSDNVKITIPKLNRGSATDMEVTYTGSFAAPHVSYFFEPGKFQLDSDVEMAQAESKWGRLDPMTDLYLSKNNGKYTGSFTIPSFMTGETFSIYVVFYNAQSLSDFESLLTSYSDMFHVNMVSLKIGGSITNGGYNSTAIDPEIPVIEDKDSDNDGYTDNIEKNFGTNPNNPASYPGSKVGQKLEKTTVNGVDIFIVGDTNGNISISPRDSVPEIPKNIGEDLGFYFEITCDEKITGIILVIDLGAIGGELIPEGTKPESIKLFYYDADLGKWVELKASSYDASTGLLRANPEHLKVFAPMISKSAGEEKNQPGGLGELMIYIIIVIIVIVILSLLGIAMKKRGNKKVPAGEAGQTPTEGQDVELSTPTGPDYTSTLYSLPPEPEPQPLQPVPPEPGPLTPEQGLQTTQEPLPTGPVFGESLQTEPAFSEPLQTEPIPTEPLPPLDEPQTISPPETLMPSEEPQLPPTQEPGPLSPALEPPQPTQGQPPLPTIQQAPLPMTQPPVQQAPPVTEPQEPVPAPPEQTPQQQLVPCPTCQNMIPVYSTPCTHCGTNLNW